MRILPLTLVILGVFVFSSGICAGESEEDYSDENSSEEVVEDTDFEEAVEDTGIELDDVLSAGDEEDAKSKDDLDCDKVLKKFSELPVCGDNDSPLPEEDRERPSREGERWGKPQKLSGATSAQLTAFWNAGPSFGGSFRDVLDKVKDVVKESGIVLPSEVEEDNVPNTIKEVADRILNRLDETPTADNARCDSFIREKMPECLPRSSQRNWVNGIKQVCTDECKSIKGQTCEEVEEAVGRIRVCDNEEQEKEVQETLDPIPNRIRCRMAGRHTVEDFVAFCEKAKENGLTKKDCSQMKQQLADAEECEGFKQIGLDRTKLVRCMNPDLEKMLDTMATKCKDNLGDDAKCNKLTESVDSIPPCQEGESPIPREALCNPFENSGIKRGLKKLMNVRRWKCRPPKADQKVAEKFCQNLRKETLDRVKVVGEFLKKKGNKLKKGPQRKIFNPIWTKKPEDTSCNDLKPEELTRDERPMQLCTKEGEILDVCVYIPPASQVRTGSGGKTQINREGRMEHRQYSCMPKYGLKVLARKE